jgi:hypothetical protein
MGIVGYTYEQVQSMPMQAVARAIGARKKFVGDILGAVFGKRRTPSGTFPERPLSPACSVRS